MEGITCDKNSDFSGIRPSELNCLQYRSFCVVEVSIRRYVDNDKDGMFFCHERRTKEYI